MRALLNHEGSRFLVAGGLAAALNWLVRFPLSALFPFEAAVGIAYAIGMSAGFALYRKWVFPGSTLPIQVQLARFVAVNAAGAVVVLIAAPRMATLCAIAGAPLELAQAVGHGVALGLGAVLNFLGHRALTFAARPC